MTGCAGALVDFRYLSLLLHISQHRAPASEERSSPVPVGGWVQELAPTSQVLLPQEQAWHREVGRPECRAHCISGASKPEDPPWRLVSPHPLGSEAHVVPQRGTGGWPPAHPHVGARRL